MNTPLKEVYVHKDDRNGIIICPDNYKGIVVQVVRFNTQLKPDHEGNLVEHRNRFAIWSKVIPTLPPEMEKQLIQNPMAPLKPKEGNLFKGEVSRTIEEAKSYLSKIESLDKMIDGSMNDYMSQNREINQSN